MKNFRGLSNLALTAGLLALCSVPVALRAQEAPQTAPEGSSELRLQRINTAMNWPA